MDAFVESRGRPLPTSWTLRDRMEFTRWILRLLTSQGSITGELTKEQLAPLTLSLTQEHFGRDLTRRTTNDYLLRAVSSGIADRAESLTEAFRFPKDYRFTALGAEELGEHRTRVLSIMGDSRPIYDFDSPRRQMDIAEGAVRDFVGGRAALGIAIGEFAGCDHGV